MDLLSIDIGHGGMDPGASGFGYQEKDLVLVIGKRVKELLKEYNPTLTRDKDIFLTNAERLGSIKHKYCISIHINSSKDGKGTGVECIHSIHSEKGKQLGEFISNAISETTGLKKRSTFSKVRSDGKDYYFMHRLTGNTITVIVECFFINNDNDIKLMNIESIAQAIAKGFREFIDKQEMEEITLLKFNRVLKRGCTGEDVKQLQLKLKEIGFYIGEIDGSFGPATDKAIRVYQSRHTLVVDGLVGPATVASLNGVKKKTN